MADAVPVLLFAHASPPLGGPGVLRAASWMRHWPAAGIEPLLLTAPPEDGARAHGYPIVPGSDAALAGRVVLRVPTGSPRGLAGLLRALHAPPRVAWTLCHRALREPEAPWPRAAVPAGIALGRERSARAVVSTSQPIAAHVAGRAVARALGVPWVADFRDPMTEAPGRAWPTRLHLALERRLEREFVEGADLVWANTEAAAARLRERFPAAARRVLARTNGVEAESLRAWPSPQPRPPLRIGHVGRFTERLPTGRLAFLDARPEGSARGRSPAPLFAAIERLLSDVPAARGRVTWVTVGDGGDAPPAGVVREHHGAVGNEEALEIAASCHALYLPLTAPGPSGALFVPQKAYEYAAIGRPVLVSGTPRETTELLGALALVAAPGDASAMAGHVRALWGGGAAAPSRPERVPTRAGVAALCAADVLGLVGQRAAASASP